MVGIVLRHGYILHIYPTSMKDKKKQLKKNYGCTTESGESGSINLLYGVSCAKQGGRFTIDKCTCQNVFFCPENAKIKKLTLLYIA